MLVIKRGQYDVDQATLTLTTSPPTPTTMNILDQLLWNHIFSYLSIASDVDVTFQNCRRSGGLKLGDNDQPIPSLLSLSITSGTHREIVSNYLTRHLLHLQLTHHPHDPSTLTTTTTTATAATTTTTATIAASVTATPSITITAPPLCLATSTSIRRLLRQWSELCYCSLISF